MLYGDARDVNQGVLNEKSDEIVLTGWDIGVREFVLLDGNWSISAIV